MVVSEKPHARLQDYILIAICFLGFCELGESQCSISYCTACISTSSTICQSCNTGYHLQDGTCCQNSLSACSRCSNPAACDSCQTGAHYLLGSNCEPCSATLPNCGYCLGPSVCYGCASSNYVLNGGICQLCSSFLAYCSTCSSTISCTGCISNSYALSGSTCQLCSSLIPNCIACNSNSICTTCVNSSFFIHINTSQCIDCNATIPYCLNCNPNVTCSQCVNSSYFIHINTSQCLQCNIEIPYCVLCSPNVTCLQCINSSYFIHINTSRCLQCNIEIPYCILCNPNVTCAQCIDSSYFIHINTSFCVHCNSTIPYCVLCNPNVTCAQCVNSSFFIHINTSFCLHCNTTIPFCINCNPNVTCAQCINDSFLIHPNTSFCDLCSVFLDYCVRCSSITSCSQCIVSTSIILNPATQVCEGCSRIMPHCLECTSTTFCNLCQPLFTIDPASTSSCIFCAQKILGCLQCSNYRTCTKCSIGVPLVGGCTRIYGCIFMVQNTQGKPSCLKCNTTEYYPDPVNGTCVCKRGQQVGPYCTDMIGCKTIERDIYGERCLACDVGGRFTIQGRICVCMPKFYMQGVICKQVCGDGFVFRLPCDDGNKIDGDGCTANCSVEPGYTCVGTANSSSKCVYEGPVKVVMDSLEKVQDINSMRLVFSVVPAIKNLEKMDSSSNIELHCNDTCQVTSSQVIGSKIYMEVVYFSDLKGVPGELAIRFDQKVIKSVPYSFPVKFKNPSGSYLVFDPYPHPLKTSLSKFALALGCLCLIVFFVASYAHKMIGVETIHVFQAVFITLGFSESYYPFAASFQSLGITMGLLNSVLGSSVISPIYPAYYNLSYAHDAITNLYFVGSMIALSFALYLISTLVLMRLQNNKESKLVGWKATAEKVAQTFKAKFYDFLAFPLLIGFSMQFILSLGIHSQTAFHSQSSSNLTKTIVAFGLLLLTFATFLVFIKEWLPICVSPQIVGTPKVPIVLKQDCKAYYVPVFLTYVFLMSIGFSLQLMSVVSLSDLGCCGLSLLFLIFLIISRPYQTLLHNLCVIFNQLTVMAAFAWVLLPKLFPLSKQLEQSYIFILLAMLSIVLVLCIIRVAIEIRFSKQKKGEIVNNKKKKLQKNSFDEYNRALLIEMSRQQSEGVNAYTMLAQRLRQQNEDKANKTSLVSKKGLSKEQMELAYEKLNISHMLKKRMVYNDSQDECGYKN